MPLKWSPFFCHSAWFCPGQHQSGAHVSLFGVPSPSPPFTLLKAWLRLYFIAANWRQVVVIAHCREGVCLPLQAGCVGHHV